jgi:hypothetical protein
MRTHWIEDIEMVLLTNQLFKYGKIIYKAGELIGNVLTNDEPSVSQDQVPADFLMPPDDGSERDWQLVFDLAI